MVSTSLTADMSTSFYKAGLWQMLFKILQQPIHAPRITQPLGISNGLSSGDGFGYPKKLLE
jgi:hypothetical protein